MEHHSIGAGWVLGGSGFVGQTVVRRALEGGLAVLSVARGAHGTRATGLSLDLSAPGTELEESLDALRPAWILNCAALSQAAGCERDPELARSMNAELPARLGSICAGLGIRLVHLSTDNVFSGELPRASGYTEEDEASPVSIYGKTKRAGELALHAANPEALIVRLPLLFGDSQGRGLGASDGLLAAIQRGEHPRMFTDEVRTPLDVGEAARALLEWVQTGPRGLLHLAGPERLTRFELAQRILAARGLDPNAIEPILQRDVPSVPPRPRDLTLDGSRARAHLSFCPANPWQKSANSGGNSAPEGSAP